MKHAFASHFWPEVEIGSVFGPEIPLLAAAPPPVPVAESGVEWFRKDSASQHWVQRKLLWIWGLLLVGLELWVRISSRIYLPLVSM